MERFFSLAAAVMLIFSLAALAVPLRASAHSINFWPTGYWGPLLSCTATGAGGGKCTSLCDIAHTIEHFIYFGMSIAVFVAAPILLAFGGITIMAAGASPELVSKGKKIVTGTIIGIVITLCAFLLVDTFLNIVTSGKMGLGNVQCTAKGSINVSL
jgi:hypothetical protein